MKEQSKLSRKPRRFLPIHSLSLAAFLQRSNQRINSPVRTQRHRQSHGALCCNLSHIITRNCIDRNNCSSFYAVTLITDPRQQTRLTITLAEQYHFHSILRISYGTLSLVIISLIDLRRKPVHQRAFPIHDSYRLNEIAVSICSLLLLLVHSLLAAFVILHIPRRRHETPNVIAVCIPYGTSYVLRQTLRAESGRTSQF